MNKPVDLPLQALVGSARPHESAHLHVAGAAPYTDDIPERAGTLHAALGLSPYAHARLKAVHLDRIRALPGVVDVFAAADLPGVNDCGPLLKDDPILADGVLRFHGQPVFAVIATTREAARRAAARAKEVIEAEPLPALLTHREAHAAGQYVIPPMHLARGDAAQALAAAPQRLKLDFELGGQEQFYLEGQISYAVPEEDGGTTLFCSTQHPSEMQHLVAHALHRPSHAVQVICRRMGGGFGGKESQSALFACVAAVAAQRNKAPVKLRLDRDDDFLITGRRHGFWFEIEAGFDGAGRILGVEATLVSNAGHSADLSGPVLTRALCHFDNAYWLPNVSLHGFAAKTNTQSNTAFRGFGGPQGAFAVEVLIDAIARKLGTDSLSVRKANLYTEGQPTPYGQPVEDFCLPDLIQELERTSDYAARRAAVDAFNAASPVLKKGLALTPVKFGISFNVVHLNQAGALVHVYTDGSVLVNHGGTEMGQGLNTNLAQLAAQTLGGRPEDVLFSQGQVTANGQTQSWEALVQQAYHARVQLWSDGFYATPGLSWDRAKLQGKPFYYFAHGAAVAEVGVDSLTGEYRLLRADVLHDVGQSLNPALDIGQVEGAFIQGMGWLTMEELVWHPDDGSAKAGLLTTHAPSTYKIPTANDCPPAFHTKLFGRPNAKDSIHRSKAVGEPPLLLPFSVFFAIKDAVSACAGHRVEPDLSAPATPEAVLRAITAAQASP